MEKGYSFTYYKGIVKGVKMNTGVKCIETGEQFYFQWEDEVNKIEDEIIEAFEFIYKTEKKYGNLAPIIDLCEEMISKLKQV